MAATCEAKLCTRATPVRVVCREGRPRPALPVAVSYEAGTPKQEASLRQLACAQRYAQVRRRIADTTLACELALEEAD